jgi:hypothetical protein
MVFWSVSGLKLRQMEQHVSLDWTDLKNALYAYGPIGTREPSTAYFDYFRYGFPTQVFLRDN